MLVLHGWITASCLPIYECRFGGSLFSGHCPKRLSEGIHLVRNLPDHFVRNRIIVAVPPNGEAF